MTVMSALPHLRDDLPTRTIRQYRYSTPRLRQIGFENITETPAGPNDYVRFFPNFSRQVTTVTRLPGDRVAGRQRVITEERGRL